MFRSKKISSKFNWIDIQSIDALTIAVESSESSAVLLFKHSTRCSISTLAKSRIETHWNNQLQLKPYLIDVLRNRDVSNQIADYFNVRHESPQALVIISMKCEGSFSHNSIEMQKIEAIVGS